MPGRPTDYMPGIPAAGHVASNGSWHPNAGSNCGKEPCKSQNERK